MEFVKVRHEPFSIYLKWLSGEVGREVLYVDGANDGEMFVRSGGWKKFSFVHARISEFRRSELPASRAFGPYNIRPAKLRPSVFTSRVA